MAIRKEFTKAGESKGTYTVYVSFKCKRTGRRHQAMRRGIENLEAAKRLEIELHDDVKALASGRRRNHTWKTWLAELIEQKRLEVKLTTLKGYESLYSVHGEAFAGLRLSEILKSDVLQYLNLIVKPTTRKKLRRDMNTVFVEAVNAGLIPASPAAGIVVKVQKPVLGVLTVPESQKLISEALRRGHPFAALWIVALKTGMRTGELYALRKSKIDLDSGRITVNEAWGSRDGYGATKTTDTRFITMSPDLHAFVAELIRQRPNDEFLLPHLPEWSAGKQAEITREFCGAIGITSVRFHDLRASVITQLLSAGVPLAQVMSVVGHVSIKTTNDYLRRAGIDTQHTTTSLKTVIPAGVAQLPGNVVSLFKAKA